MSQRLLLLAFAPLLFASACEGPKGATGPQGPEGNANVKSYDVTVTSSQWTYDALYQRWYVRLASSADFQSAILGYVMSGSGQQAMPYREQTSVTNVQYDLAKALFLTPPYIELQYTNFSSRNTRKSTDTYFEIVIIPPGAMIPGLDTSDLLAVKNAYGL